MKTKFNSFLQFGALKPPLALESPDMAQDPALPQTNYMALGNSSNFLAIQIPHMQVKKLRCNSFKWHPIPALLLLRHWHLLNF